MRRITLGLSLAALVLVPAAGALAQQEPARDSAAPDSAARDSAERAERAGSSG